MKYETKDKMSQNTRNTSTLLAVTTKPMDNTKVSNKNQASAILTGEYSPFR
jgi:hypothetical protein